MSRKNYGLCALCRKEGELTFEHIPPRAAFNSNRAKIVTLDSLLSEPERRPWQIEGLHYNNLQKGMGMASLCKKCNNDTGTLYGEEYRKFALTIAKLLQENPNLDNLAIEIEKFYPARIIKQVISMFCSINNYDDTRLNALREFVLDKHKTMLDTSKYKVSMYYTRSRYARLLPFTVSVHFDEGTSGIMCMSEITTYPFGFILYLDPTDNWNYHGTDITSFFQFDYNTPVSAQLSVPIYEVNNWAIEDYRTKEEIEAGYKHDSENGFK